MEHIADHIKLAESKQASIRKLFDQACGEASSVLSLTHQWKVVENQIELAKFSLLKHGQELDLKAKTIAEITQLLEQRDQEVVLKSKEVNAMLDDLISKDNYILLFSKWLQDFTLELISKEKQLNLALKEIEGCDGVLRLKREELDSVQKEHEKYSKELATKKLQLGTTEKSIELQNEEFKSNEKKLGLLRMKLKECCKNLSVKNKKLESVQESLQLRCKEFVEKEAEVENLKSLAASCDSQIELKQTELAMKTNNLSTVESSIEERVGQLKSETTKWLQVKETLEKCCQEHSVKTKQLESMQKELEVIEKEVEKAKTSSTKLNEELELKQKGLAMVKGLIRDSRSELELKQKQVETLQELANVHSTELDLKLKELSGIETSVEQCQNKLDLKRKEFDATQTNIEECQKELDWKQKQLTKVLEKIEASPNALSSKDKHVDSVSEELESKEKQQKVELIDKSISQRSSKVVSIQCKKCIKLLTEKLRSEEPEFGSVKRKVCGFCNELKEREMHFDSLKSTLEERSRKLEMKEKQFEARLKEFELNGQQTAICQAFQPFDFRLQAHQPDNSQSSANIDEKTSASILTDDMDDNDLLPDDVLAVLKLSADPAMFVLGVMQDSHSRASQNGTAGLDTIFKTKILLMEKLIEVSPTISRGVKAEAAKQAVSWKANLSLGSEKLTEVWAFLLFLAAYRLVNHFGGEEILNLVLVVSDQGNAPNICRLLNFEDKIPEIIERLIETKQHIDAARFTIAFGLLHKFSLQFILQNWFDHMKGKAIDEEIGVLNAILQLISDYKLKSRYDTQSTRRCIIELENQKLLCSRTASSLTPVSYNTQQQQLQLHNKKYRDGFVLEGKSKRARTGTSYGSVDG